MLRVSRSGRRLAAARLTLWCRRGGSSYIGTLKLALRANRAATVGRDGRFSFPAAGFSRASGRVRLWLAGRFVSARHARLFYRVRDLPRRGSRDCRSTHERYPDYSPAVLGLDGVPPFSGCRSQRATTLLRSDASRVFTQYAPSDESDPWSSGLVTHVYACLFAKPKRRVDLGRNYDDETIEVPRIASTLVAYSVGVTSLAGSFAQIRVLDLSKAIPARTVDATPGPPQSGTNRVRDLVLKPNGSLAWTVGRGSFDPAYPAFQQQLWARDASGERLLDSGPNVHLESLELNGSTLTWLHGEIPRSATLN